MTVARVRPIRCVRRQRVEDSGDRWQSSLRTARKVARREHRSTPVDAVGQHVERRAIARLEVLEDVASGGVASRPRTCSGCLGIKSPIVGARLPEGLFWRIAADMLDESDFETCIEQASELHAGNIVFAGIGWERCVSEDADLAAVFDEQRQRAA